jgi:hypothetical protein
LRDALRQPFLGNAKTKTALATDRTAIYAELFARYTVVLRTRSLSTHIEIDNVQVEDECRKFMKEQLDAVKEALLVLVRSFPTQRPETYAEFDMIYDNLRAFHECFDDSTLKPVVVTIQNEITREMEEKLRSLREDAYAQVSANTGGEPVAELIARVLISMKSITIAVFKTAVDEQINMLLRDIKQLPEGARHIGMVAVTLSANKRNPAAQVREMPSWPRSWTNFSLF